MKEKHKREGGQVYDLVLAASSSSLAFFAASNRLISLVMPPVAVHLWNLC